MKNGLLIFASLLIAVLIAEVSVRFILPQDLSGSWLERSPRGFLMNKNQGVVRHQFRDHLVFYHFYPPHLRGTPVKNIPEKILVLGDSFSFGWLLSWPKTYVYQLQKNADKVYGAGRVQFLNASTADWGTADMLAYLNTYGAELHPNVVLIFMNSDDIGRAFKRNIFRLDPNHSGVLLPHYPRSQRGLKVLLSKLPGYNWLLEHSELLQLMRNTYLKLFVYKKRARNWALGRKGVDIPYSPDLMMAPEKAQKFGKALFIAIKRWCVLHHAKLLVTTTGFNHFYPVGAQDPTQSFLKIAPVFFKREHVPFNNVPEQVVQVAQLHASQIPGDSHPTAYEDKRIARFVWPFINKQLRKEDAIFARST